MLRKNLIQFFITAVEPYSGADDFAGILAQYTAGPPDIIYCPEYYVLGAALVNTAYQIGLNRTYILGADAYDGILTYVTHPEAMKNVYYSAPFSFDSRDPAVNVYIIQIDGGYYSMYEGHEGQ